MRRGAITRGLIESIVRNDNIEYIDAVDEKMKAIVSNAVEDLSKRDFLCQLEQCYFATGKRTFEWCYD